MNRDRSDSSFSETHQAKLLQRFHDAQQLYERRIRQIDSEANESENVEGLSHERTGLSRPLFYDGLYAPSGFDMMSILMRVVGRPNPKIDIGAVDTNAAIILCDTHAHDTPIVYCSEGFEALTGYNSKEILGRNCRFLQSPSPPPLRREETLPETETVAGTALEAANSAIKRRRISGPQPPGEDIPRNDREMLSQFKSHLESGMEAQITLTNYRKGGARFTNLLTAIPIRWDSDSSELRYIVGFQADRNNVVFTPP